ncbi:MAG: multicopper oxidase domain-containing protein [Acidobacteria bacterium]|nr:multicopper oxidase domain-containing protein [Acidobacteriota bacterium]
MDLKLNRRKLLGGALGAFSFAGARSWLGKASAPEPDQPAHHPHAVEAMSSYGDVDLNSFNPSDFLYQFDYGRVSRLPGGRALREYQIVAVDKEIEVVPGVFFPAWTYNGQVPGPTLRCTQGDLLRVHFVNGGTHPHTIHFHGFHPANMDGVFEVVNPGQEYTYEFEAEPFGLHLYHCHTVPLKRHIHKGLYGAFIIDPQTPRPPAREMVMVMNGFDTNFDAENEIYAVNTVAFHYHRYPIEVKLQELVRIYLVNVLEFDLVNSLHIHGHFFNVYRTGTRPDPDDFTDTVMMCQGERHILELQFRNPGRFMFHAHQSEFAELGWMGFFDVKA